MLKYLTIFKTKDILLKLQYIFCFLFSALLFCCFISAYINPGTFWLPALIALGYPILMAISLLLLIFCIARKNKLTSVTLGVVIVLNAFSIPDFIGFGRTKTLADPDLKRVKIMSWNIHNFQTIEGSPHTLTHDVLNVIDSLKPDILCIQEYYDQSNRGMDISDSIRKRLHVSYTYFQRIKNNYTGMVIFSRFPILKKGDLRKLGAPNCRQCIFADILLDDKTYRVYTVHLQSYYLPDKKQTQSKTAYNILLAEKLKIGLAKRSRQIIELKKQMAACRYPIILTGDFNDTPLSYTYKQLSKGLNNAFTEKGSGYGKTYNSFSFPFQIDYILASPEFKIQRYQVVENLLSDHYPVTAELSY